MGNLISQSSVEIWLADYSRHWGAEASGVKEKLAVLADFCELTGREPDVIIRECLREGEDGQRIRLKVRQRYIDSIREFETKHSGGREAGNVIRSFFIHNGVAMSPHIAETYNTQGAS